jgi:zinc transport system ATP-binding protein
MSAALTFRDLHFGYDGKPVLSNVNVTIPEGDFVCAVGPNGSGKTTLLKIALGLLKPTRGEIEVFGQRPDRSRGRIGYVPHSTPCFRSAPWTWS